MAGTYQSFDDITGRLDEIVVQVRSKDTSLERSLDLFDEAIELGARAVDLVDSFEFSERESELLDAPAAAGSGTDSGTDSGAVAGAEGADDAASADPAASDRQDE